MRLSIFGMSGLLVLLVIWPAYRFWLESREYTRELPLYLQGAWVESTPSGRAKMVIGAKSITIVKPNGFAVHHTAQFIWINNAERVVFIPQASEFVTSLNFDLDRANNLTLIEHLGEHYTISSYWKKQL